MKNRVTISRLVARLRSWTDGTVSAEHTYVYDMVAEITDPTNQDHKDILPFQKISIESPSASWRKEMIESVTSEHSEIQHTGHGHVVHLEWDSANINAMDHWIIERKEGTAVGQANAFKEEFSIGEHNTFTDDTVDDRKQYVYDFVAVGNTQSAEGHPVEIHLLTKSLSANLPKEILNEFAWPLGRKK